MVGALKFKKTMMKPFVLITALIVSPLVAAGHFDGNDKDTDFRAPDYETSATKSITDHSRWGRGTGDAGGAVTLSATGSQGNTQMWIKSTKVIGGNTCKGTPKECSGGGR